ncbi:CvfD/Ygs/GSP13 family RNA-binding post-transcriptional regulator [Enterococcus alishanensis]|uniref:S1 RNA-binding domain-containing protein n=1 Tax=Enterococcus alishanensis TaxID=1303817 RepID=A0ABS6THD5_9ENTE|nr:CvfD/Ygs/GSP13 family RNA-binding post-transcriptional regulator [Enterococcus alishanensis]MBV7392293.1 S1 RNA-binding domain-containing protein [Enterococcus alishanensis]
MSYKIGQVIKGKITGIQPYGAFVSLDDQTQGLIHVSEIQSGYTKNIHQYLNVGETVKVQIIDIDEYTEKISLSLRTLMTHPAPPSLHRKRYFTNRNKHIGFRSLAENMPIWTKETYEALQENAAAKIKDGNQ